jgi:hypothetical protein
MEYAQPTTAISLRAPPKCSHSKRLDNSPSSSERSRGICCRLCPRFCCCPCFSFIIPLRGICCSLPSIAKSSADLLTAQRPADSPSLSCPRRIRTIQELVKTSRAKKTRNLSAFNKIPAPPNCRELCPKSAYYSSGIPPRKDSHARQRNSVKYRDVFAAHFTRPRHLATSPRIPKNPRPSSRNTFSPISPGNNSSVNTPSQN